MSREDKFIRDNDQPDRMRDLIDDHRDYLTMFFSDKIIFHKNVKKHKMDKYFIIATCYLVKNKIDEFNLDIDNMQNMKKIRLILNELYKKNKNTDKYMNAISDKFDEISEDNL
jgi:hypothetical protein